MSRIKTAASLLALTLLCLSMTACNGLLVELTGHYEGSLFERTDGNGHQRPVKSDISNDGHGHATVAVKDAANTPILTITLTDIQNGKFKISIPGVAPQAVELVEKSGCFLRQADQSLRFCLDKGELLLEVTLKDKGKVFTLALDRFKKLDAFVMETPRDFTTASAVDYALRMNFDNRVEFEHVIQSRLSRSLARLNLLPGVTLSSVISLVVKDPASIISSIGDLAPFLLPTRWLQASEAGLRTQAEEDALVLMRADTATQVEGFAAILARDRAILKFYLDTLAQAMEVRDEIQSREDLGQYIPGTSDDIRSVVNGIEQATSALELAVKEDKTAIAQTLGFHNPEAIAEFTLDPELEPINGATPIRKTDVKRRDEIKTLALDRSFEIRQMDYLIRIGRLQKIERYFAWLDPAADGTGKIGFGIGQYVKTGSSQLRELVTKREQLEQNIVLKVFNAVIEHNLSIKSYGLASEGMEIQERRLARILETVRFGTNVDMFGMVQIFQDYLAAEVSKENAIATYRAAHAKMDRFLLKGHYAGLVLRPDPGK
ncbi:MAG: hypothetical protein HY074_11440 [Deltaproteobacteria bacterium]|nr:hypothetical protein [Deltaproteobacteria bacterium]